MSNYRYFSIPGNSQTEWDPEVHGIELSEDDLGTGDVAEICWKPGEYFFSTGCGDQGYTIQAIESPNQKEPEQAVLKGFHLFLGAIDFE